MAVLVVAWPASKKWAAEKVALFQQAKRGEKSTGVGGGWARSARIGHKNRKQSPPGRFQKVDIKKSPQWSSWSDTMILQRRFFADISWATKPHLLMWFVAFMQTQPSHGNRLTPTKLNPRVAAMRTGQPIPSAATADHKSWHLGVIYILSNEKSPVV